jgi:hypothetical protein
MKRAGRLQSLEAVAIGGKTEKLGISEAVVGIPAGAAEHSLVVVEAGHQSPPSLRALQFASPPTY